MTVHSSYRRYLQVVGKMAPGTMGGQSRVATPAIDVRQVLIQEPQPPLIPAEPNTTLTATLIPEATASSVGWQTQWNPATIDGDGLTDNQAVARRWEVAETGVVTVDLTLTWLDIPAGKDGIGVRTLTFVHTDSLNAFIDQIQHSQPSPSGANAVGLVQGSLSVSAGDRLYVTVFHNAGGNITVDDGDVELSLDPNS